MIEVLCCSFKTFLVCGTIHEKSLVALGAAKWFRSCVYHFMICQGSCCIGGSWMVSLQCVSLHVLSKTLVALGAAEWFHSCVNHFMFRQSLCCTGSIWRVLFLCLSLHVQFKLLLHWEQLNGFGFRVYHFMFCQIILYWESFHVLPDGCSCFRFWFSSCNFRWGWVPHLDAWV